MKYKNLFTKGKIGKLVLKNRIVMPAMGVNLSTSTGEATDDIIRYYEERAKGGCGLIITEITRIDNEYGVGISNQLAVTDISQIPRLERLTRTIHKYGTKIFIQLHHPGRQNHSQLIKGKQIVAPSPVMCKVCREMPRELTTEEVQILVKKFIKGAKIALIAGADGVELHAAHGYLINQFISPYTNKRTDKYGGDFAGRMQFISEIIMGIKAVCGKDFPISVRIDGDEFVEGGNGLKEAVKIAKYLENLGVDAINVSCGIYETAITIIEPMSYPQGWKKHLAQDVKDAINIPVIAVDVIRKPDFAEYLLSEGNCDFVAVGRAQLADPNWGNKAKKGQDREIRPCISCCYCIEQLNSGKCSKCAVNARMGRELEYDEFKKDGKGRCVVIIGAGPAGLEAARVLALRDFKPILFEKSDKLGGCLNLANKPPHKEKIDWLIDYFEYQMQMLNVDVRLNSEPTLSDIKSLKPYAVFVATGSLPIIPSIPGIEKDNVCTVRDILNGNVKFIGKKTAVIGSGMTGLETAELLAAQENKVSVIEMFPEIGPGMYKVNLYDVVSRLKKYNVELLPSHKLIEIDNNEITLESTINKRHIIKDCDKVVLSLGVLQNNSIVKQLEDNFDNVVCIGDVNRIGKIAEAIEDAFGKAYVI